jgi:hypothetical protein
MPKRSGWQGPVPPAIVRCSDHWITQRFKKLCAEASDVLYLPKGEQRKKREAELNQKLKELIQQAEYKNEQKGT